MVAGIQTVHANHRRISPNLGNSFSGGNFLEARALGDTRIRCRLSPGYASAAELSVSVSAGNVRGFYRLDSCAGVVPKAWAFSPIASTLAGVRCRLQASSDILGEVSLSTTEKSRLFSKKVNVTDTKSIPSDQIICTEFDGGEGILVDLNTKRYYELNETALLVWKGLEKGLGIDDIVAEVMVEYDVQPEHARSSVETLMTRLRSYQLVSD